MFQHFSKEFGSRGFEIGGRGSPVRRAADCAEEKTAGTPAGRNGSTIRVVMGSPVFAAGVLSGRRGA